MDHWKAEFITCNSQAITSRTVVPPVGANNSRVCGESSAGSASFLFDDGGSESPLVEDERIEENVRAYLDDSITARAGVGHFVLLL